MPLILTIGVMKILWKILKEINCNKIAVFEGDASLLINKKYDVIIANINRNILLMDMKVYTDCLNEKGILLLSGFY